MLSATLPVIEPTRISCPVTTEFRKRPRRILFRERWWYLRTPEPLTVLRTLKTFSPWTNSINDYKCIYKSTQTPLITLLTQKSVQKIRCEWHPYLQQCIVLVLHWVAFGREGQLIGLVATLVYILSNWPLVRSDTVILSGHRVFSRREIHWRCMFFKSTWQRKP